MEGKTNSPILKQAIKDSIYNLIYNPVHKILEERLNQIITKNSVLSGASHLSFMYKGNLYSCDTSRPPRVANKLLLQLHPQMDAYLKECKELTTNEIPYVLGFITQVLNASNNVQDYLRVFPESVHAPIKALVGYSCSTKSMSEQEVNNLKTNNQKSIDLMKQRMMINLIVQENV